AARGNGAAVCKAGFEEIVGEDRHQRVAAVQCDEILKKIAVEITEKLRASTTVDWQVRESVRARLRILVRRCLQKWKYPPDRQADAVELVLKQAESLSNEWSK
ncbi:type I restriction enzyme endonuclease domain-containing protein, partial [Acidithiobacillus ferrivorans]|uniref:type I restriction enzyme endonuclease domain-containing protein n=1 Tax=Acidithiobacillus ferrivorans TaxID=160808 RepID=UPI001146C01F